MFFETINNTGDQGTGPVGGFTLPGISNTTNFYIYSSKAYMEWNSGGGGNRDSEIHTTIEPSYPDGAMIKVPLGDISNYQTKADYAIAHSNLGPTGFGYSIDNSVWTDSGSPAIPFADEYHYQSTGYPGTSGGKDSYRMQPVTINDHRNIWILFYMPGISNSYDNFSDTELHGAVRMFAYHPSSESASQAFYASCKVYDHNDFSLPSPVAHIQDVTNIASINGSTVTIVGETNSTAYSAEFGGLH